MWHAPLSPPSWWAQVDADTWEHAAFNGSYYMRTLWRTTSLGWVHAEFATTMAPGHSLMTNELRARSRAYAQLEASKSRLEAEAGRSSQPLPPPPPPLQTDTLDEPAPDLVDAIDDDALPPMPDARTAPLAEQLSWADAMFKRMRLENVPTCVRACDDGGEASTPLPLPPSPSLQ